MCPTFKPRNSAHSVKLVVPHAIANSDTGRGPFGGEGRPVRFAMALEDYKDIVATAASITTIGQFFAGMFICKDIVKKGSTENISVVPFLGGTAIGVLMLQYSNILNDPAMTRVNVVGLSLNLGYLFCYYIYSSNTMKGAVHSQLLYTSLAVATLLGYVHLEDPKLVEFRFGMIVTALMMYLIASPLFSLGEVIRTKSTETLPLPLIFSGTIVTFLWLLYGIIIKNSFIQLQNIIGFILCSLQLSLFLIYPRTPVKEKKSN